MAAPGAGMPFRMPMPSANPFGGFDPKSSLRKKKEESEEGEIGFYSHYLFCCPLTYLTIRKNSFTCQYLFSSFFSLYYSARSSNAL